MPFKKNRLKNWTKVSLLVGAIVFAPSLTYGKRVDHGAKPVSA